MIWIPSCVPAPEFVAPPEVSALSSTALKVVWSTTEGQGIIARGRVTEYRVNLLTEQTNNPYAPPLVSQVRCNTTKFSYTTEMLRYWCLWSSWFFSPGSFLFSCGALFPPRCIKPLIVTVKPQLFVSPLQVLHRAGPSSQPVFIARGLEPFQAYNFTVTLCTKAGCISSLPGTGRTRPAGTTADWETSSMSVYISLIRGNRSSGFL